MDSGCQVIMISKAVSHELAIAYDLTFCISMQSANGELDMSLGLTWNVPFKIGPVTFYLQAHVIDSNAYDILLGQPFDILTESVIRNFANKDQTITIMIQTPANMLQSLHWLEELASKSNCQSWIFSSGGAVES